MKKKKIKVNSIIYMLLCLIVIFFWSYLLVANILPIKYVLIGLSAFIVWLAIIYFVMFFKRKKTSKKRDIIGYIISGFLVILMAFIYIYLSKTLDFFSDFTGENYKSENYLVVVLNNDTYNKLDDLKNKEIGYVPSELNKIGEALNLLNEKIKIENKKYEVFDKLFNDLTNKKIASILIEEANLNIIKENNDYADKIKVIDTITIKTKIEHSKDVEVSKKPFNIYISGIDTYGSISSVARSDVNIVMTVNPNTKQVLLITTPRDYYVQLRGTSGLKDKLTHAGSYGIDTSIGTLEDLLQADINYYFRVNFSTLEKIINAIGGVDVYSKYSFTSSAASGGTYRFSTGYNHMNGKQALSFSRERKNVTGGDRTRGINQQAVIDGVIRKVTSPSIITKYSSLLNSLKGSFQTNMTDKDITSLIKMQLNDMAKWNITSHSLDGTDASEYTYSYTNQKLYVMKPDMTTVNEAISKIDKVLAGEKLDSSYGEVGNIKNPSTVTPSTPKPTPKPDPTPEPTPEPKPDPKPVEPEPEEPKDDPLDPVLPEKPTTPENPDSGTGGSTGDNKPDDGTGGSTGDNKPSDGGTTNKPNTGDNTGTTTPGTGTTTNTTNKTLNN